MPTKCYREAWGPYQPNRSEHGSMDNSIFKLITISKSDIKRRSLDYI